MVKATHFKSCFCTDDMSSNGLNGKNLRRPFAKAQASKATSEDGDKVQRIEAGYE